MSRPISPVPAIALTLDQAAEFADVEKQLLLGQIFHGYLAAKRTSPPYSHGEPPWGLSWTGGKYLIGVDDLLDWVIERKPMYDERAGPNM